MIEATNGIDAIKANRYVAEIERELDELLSALSPEDRRLHFFENKDAVSLELVNLLSQKVDAIKSPADRKAFFLAHPELEVRYSAKNFTN